MKKALHTRPMLPTPAQLFAWLALAAFAFVTAVSLSATGHPSNGNTSESATQTPANPTLGNDDQTIYLAIDRAQKSGDFDAADGLIAQLDNRGLLGYVLAERYLDPRYDADARDLAAWLKRYADHPQARRVANLASAHGVKASLPPTLKPLSGVGFSDHLGRSGMPDAWFHALSEWRKGNHRAAANAFRELSANENLNPWQRSAAHFWAARALTELGDEDAAEQHLTAAASNDTTFYGLLAARTQGSVRLEVAAPRVSDALRHHPAAVRAALLSQLSRNEEAEQELRALYASVPQHKRRGIVTLASEMNLPNLQMRLARTTGLSNAEAHFAKFPMPQYMTELAPVMDPALLMAVARNESGFLDSARNAGSGATGMMQMLPSTARTVERRVGEALLREASASPTSSLIERLNNPATSARYGAEYLRMLAREKAVDGNLIHLLISYNAGIGRVISWKAASNQIQDPLLFIESIPYAETRNYVMQVLAQYWTYQLMMDEEADTLTALSKGSWPVMPKKNT